jgi:hypothetical protein
MLPVAHVARVALLAIVCGSCCKCEGARPGERDAWVGSEPKRRSQCPDEINLVMHTARAFGENLFLEFERWCGCRPGACDGGAVSKPGCELEKTRSKLVVGTRDPWGNEFHPRWDGDVLTITSWGPDGRPGGLDLFCEINARGSWCGCREDQDAANQGTR